MVVRQDCLEILFGETPFSGLGFAFGLFPEIFIEPTFLLFCFVAFK